ncbi:hypothetical protein LSTR_LSTR012949 [Laodelphax striatellus]|uniref:C2H2-type domain-containing protein n=1 Tax=Laodelphax striatellus TaxID=195883 RepID=A0A482X043_LAOST|nr:hypothetical protein LSTR_LSTR012949 [Laodelphax striatellus]
MFSYVFIMKSVIQCNHFGPRGSYDAVGWLGAIPVLEHPSELRKPFQGPKCGAGYCGLEVTMTKPNSSGGGGGSSRPSRSGKPLPPAVNGGGKKPLRAVRALKQPDNSVLRPPLETSVAGLRQAVRLFETSTPEVVHLMSFECDIIYECRVCKNLFRSVANFISHKRIYCTRRFNHVQNSQVVEDHTLLMDGCDEPPQLTAPTRITARQDLTTIVQQASMAQYYRDAEDKVAQREQTRFDATVHLQPIDNTTYGVSELQNLMMMKEGVTLGPDGKILPNGSRLALEPDSSSSSLVTPEKTPKAKQCPPSAHEEHTLSHHEHICGLCKIKFSSKKTLSHHTRNVHCSFRVAYTCPCCTNFFTNTWSVMRHLARVHRKTNDQVRRLRPQIQKKQVHAEKLLKKQGDASNKSSPTGSTSSSNNKRLAATPDKSELASSEVVKKGSTEVLRCAGCRRQFERQAAFQSHTQICHKRLALFGGGGSGEKCGSSKMASPKPSNSSEKRIGIQLRVNYCKSATGASPSPSPVATTSPKSRRSERHKNEAAPCVDRRASLQLTPLSSRHSSKERLCENGSAPASAPPSRPKIDTKLKTKKIESISRLLMEAIGGGASNCLPIINGVKHCDNDDDHTNLVVPKQDNDAGDKCSRSSSCSASVAAGDSEKTRDADSRSSSGRVSRSRTGGRLSSADVSKAEDDAPLMKELVVEVNGVQHEGDEAGGQLSPSKEGVIRVLTRYQLKSICKKDDVKEEVVDEGEEVKSSEVDVEPEQLQVDRLREMFRTNILYKSLQCLVCLEKMKNIVELKNHVAEHFGCNHFRCTFAQCSFVTYARGECIRHVMRAHLKQNERHLAAGYIGKVDDKKTDSEQENAIPKPNGSQTLQKSSAVARRKRSLPLKKDSPPKNGGGGGGGGGNSVKQESADAAEGDQTKAKSGNNAKKRKLNAEVGGDSSAAAPQATGNEPAQLPSEKVEMTAPGASDSDEDATRGEAEEEEEECKWSPRSFRGFTDDGDGATIKEAAASRRRHSELEQCNIRTMVMNVIFGPDHAK